MLYREGLSGWFIFIAGMAILLFILTLTASPFVAILVMAGVGSLCMSLYSGRIKWWLILGVPLIVLMAFVPTMLNKAVEAAEEKAAAEGTLNNALSRLMAISESYPELKANANFVDLQRQLQQMENEIANSRKYYNGVVKSYNIKCQSIPSNIVASMAHFTVKPLFEITNEVERANVKVQF